MDEVVLDASAILALLQSERGAETLTDEILENAVASTVNLAEVQSRLVKGATLQMKPGRTLFRPSPRRSPSLRNKLRSRAT